MESKSQFGQDINIIKYFKEKKNGFFIELGAIDGVFHSNTYLLEKKYNWNGVLIEADPRYKDALLNSERECFKLTDIAVYNEDNKEIEFTVNNIKGWSGIKSSLPSREHNNQIIKVKTKTLTTILNEVNAPKNIDLLSLDVEGGEINVLKGLDLEKYKIKMILIELNKDCKTKVRNEILKILHNYKILKEDISDTFFILKE
tara:strand:- start:1104 stop:1706 length:603 start_codon:yes stop_codon:yes gene_type:complete